MNHRIAAPLVLTAALASSLVALAGCMRRHDGGYAYAPAPTHLTPSISREADIDGATVAGGRTASSERMAWSAQGDESARDTGDLRIADASPWPGDRDLGKGADKEPLGGRGDGARGEGYAAINDNRFIAVARQDHATFGVDVDTASWSNVRRFITANRRLPPPDAVRIEELLNAFRYAYAPPASWDAAPLRVHATVVDCPWRAGHRIARIALKGREIPREQRPPANLVFLVDTSGSMDEETKLPLVKRSLSLLAEQLDERDRIALVTYAGGAGIALEPMPGDRRRAIQRAIGEMRPGGSTHGSAGIRTAYDLARRMRRDGAATRVILCTDGDFNVGVTDPAELKRLIAEEAKSGVFLNCYGFGMGNLQDATLETLADRGNGIYAYIDREQEARRVVCDDLLGQLVTIARDAKIQIWFNPSAVASWRLIGYENRRLRREDFTDDRVDAGDIGAGHSVTALFEIVPAAGAIGVEGNPFIAADRGEPAPAGADAATALEVRLRWQPPGGGQSTESRQRVPMAAAEADADTQLALALAGFGMLLRGSPHAGDLSWGQVLTLARAACADRRDPQRAELLELIGQAQRLRR